MSAVFVTATDTGVGKTTVACALLTAARRRGLSIVGVILCRAVESTGADEPTNASMIERYGEVPVLGVLPHLADPQARAAAFEANVDVAALLARL